MKRPDLSFITSKKFNSFDEYREWLFADRMHNSSRHQKLLIKLPELIQIAEMYHDSLLNNQDSIVFKQINKILNEL